MNISMRIWRKSIAYAAILAAGFLASGVLAMQEASRKPAPEEALVKPEGPQDYKMRGDATKPPAAGSLGDHAIDRMSFSAAEGLGDALIAFRDAQEGPEKEAGKAALKKKLTEIFEADMKARKAQADEIETRLKKLQEQYKSREEAKERIIDLQIEVLEKDAAGLGFPAGGGGKVLSRNGKTNREPWLNTASEIGLDSPETFRSAMGAGLKRRVPTLNELMQFESGAIAELQKKGHFVISADGNVFAHVSTNYPKGPSTVYVQDSKTGMVLATYQADGVIAEIRFQLGGVGVRMPEGKFEVKITLDPSATNGQNKGTSANPLENAKKMASGDSGGGDLDDYSKLRTRYLNAKKEFDKISHDWKLTVEEDRKKEPNVTIDELRARYHTFTPGYDWAQNAFQEAEALLETKLKLLALDVESAKASLSVSDAEFSTAEKMTKDGLISNSEIRRLSLQREKQKIELTRAETILQLFQSIKADAQPKPEAAKR